MQAVGIDERRMVSERIGAALVVFFYEGPDNPGSVVDSYLLTGADLPEALRWIRQTVPPGACWSLGVVTSPENASAGTDFGVAWIIGADVFNIDPANRTPEEERLARQMLDRRDRVDLSR